MPELQTCAVLRKLRGREARGGEETIMQTTDRAARMCPKCGEDCRVYWTYDRDDGARIRRVKCCKCGLKFETAEIRTRIIKKK